MPRVHVHAAIWIDGKLVVHRHRYQGQTRLSLPGGRVKEREGIIDALHRETREEIGQAIDVGDLLLAGQVSSTAHVGLVLVFAATLRAAQLDEPIHDLVGPESDEWAQILPPVVAELAGANNAAPAWRGELSLSARPAVSTSGGGLRRPQTKREDDRGSMMPH